MQVNFGSDEPIERIAAGEINHLFQPDGIAFFTRRVAVIGKRGHVDHIVLFSDTEAALLLPGEKPAEARLDAYAGQAREPYVAPTLTEYPLTTTDYALPDTQGTVDLAAEANPPRFQIGDRVTPIHLDNHCHFLAEGGIYTVDYLSYGSHGMDRNGDKKGWKVGFVGIGRVWPASQFRLASAEAAPDNAALIAR